MFGENMDRILAGVGKLVRALVYLTLILPGVIVVATSFSSGDAMRFPPRGFSLRWYYAFWESSLFIDSLTLSLKVAALATVLSLLIGFAAAFAIERHNFSGQELIRGFILSPLLIPAVVLGLGLMQLQVWIGLSETFLGLLIGHVVVMLPYVVRTLSASMIRSESRTGRNELAGNASDGSENNNNPAACTGHNFRWRVRIRHILRKCQPLNASRLPERLPFSRQCSFSMNPSPTLMHNFAYVFVRTCIV
ncbi:hypothetical protein KIP88_40385 [Bradyrhizobium sp. SRL28]|uniref:ABC transporter permease n=1 Tax=Bradyrhizobium sp. SRL28 TaxID=2836178 RepID=UPI001BDEFC9A|nr:hypothetical protein [Bradyrhizobium sp. SRL28]MBT1516681.1 hypothetical protein [Bradyrhizobium sp. SRL28]